MNEEVNEQQKSGEAQTESTSEALSGGGWDNDNNKLILDSQQNKTFGEDAKSMLGNFSIVDDLDQKGGGGGGGSGDKSGGNLPGGKDDYTGGNYGLEKPGQNNPRQPGEPPTGFYAIDKQDPRDCDPGYYAIDNKDPRDCDPGFYPPTEDEMREELGRLLSEECGDIGGLLGKEPKDLKDISWDDIQKSEDRRKRIKQLEESLPPMNQERERPDPGFEPKPGDRWNDGWGKTNPADDYAKIIKDMDNISLEPKPEKPPSEDSKDMTDDEIRQNFDKIRDQFLNDLIKNLDKWPQDGNLGSKIGSWGDDKPEYPGGRTWTPITEPGGRNGGTGNWNSQTPGGWNNMKPILGGRFDQYGPGRGYDVPDVMYHTPKTAMPYSVLESGRRK